MKKGQERESDLYKKTQLVSDGKDTMIKFHDSPLWTFFNKKLKRLLDEKNIT